MIELSLGAERQLEALLTHYLKTERPEAITNLVAAVRQAAAAIEQSPAAGLHAPRPYPRLAHPGELWTKAGRYWIAYRTSTPPIIVAVFHDQADIPRRYKGSAEEPDNA